LSEEKKGCLYLCPTPIGNLEDVTLRVLRTLQEVGVIAAEDTRRTKKLLSHYKIQTPLISYREQNHKTQGEELLSRLAQGDDVALVSDAGMPGISDPGFELARAAMDRDLPVEVLPGPSAVLTGLLSSGYQPVPFVFFGFLPARGKARKEALEKVKEESNTLILYEAPHRLVRTLEDLVAYGCVQGAVCREMTKKFAETRRGSLKDHLGHFRDHAPRGEFVIVLSAEREAVVEEEVFVPVPVEVADLMGKGMTKKEAMQKVARRRGLKKSEVYRQCHGIQRE
jgi:16S rRNA (cytidine1402-2'-O)-methyltransferase